MSRNNKYFIKTYGCQMNTHDSEKIAGILESLGYEETKSLEDSNLFIINSCSVRQAAEDSVYGLGKQLKKLPKKPFVILCGCMVGSAKGDRVRYDLDYIKTKIPWVDAFLEPSEINLLPQIVPHETLGESRTSIVKRAPGKHAFVNISTGCDNFCTFCVVPYARGKEISFSKEKIISEIKTLVEKGYTEITLLGQNVNSWGLTREKKFKLRTGSTQKLPFATLLREVCAISKINKVSFLSSNPFDFTLDLVSALKNPKIDRYFHIAVQSGDDEILHKMGRRHKALEFIKLIEEIRRVRPDCHIGTDIIVGFPGETEKQFENTVKLCKKVKFNNVFIAMYSPRLGTASQKLYKDNVPLKIKRARHAKLLRVIKSFNH